MKHRSNKLWLYLRESGALNGSLADIVKARADYMRKYKREWKRNNKKPQKELRPVFTIRQYMDLKVTATQMGFSPSGYCKALALAAIAAKQIVPQKETLEKVLQLIALSKLSNRINTLDQAEQLLLEYLQTH